MEDPFFVFKTISPEDVFYISSGEMDPIHFCFIFSIVFIFLQFLWPVQDNISCVDNGFVLGFVKVKMNLPGCNIDDLIVQPALGAVGGELGMIR